VLSIFLTFGYFTSAFSSTAAGTFTLVPPVTILISLKSKRSSPTKALGFFISAGDGSSFLIFISSFYTVETDATSILVEVIPSSASTFCFRSFLYRYRAGCL